MNQIHQGADERLLVVDDEEYIREILCRWLRRDGYICDMAASADEAWERLDQHEYSLLLSDIGMPGRSGIELLQQVSKRFGDQLAVVMVTGQSDRQTAVRALEFGAYDYVIKPLDQNELTIRIANAVKRRKLALQSWQFQQLLEARVRSRTAQIHQREEEIAWRLIWALDGRDQGTGTHVRRIGLFAVILAEALGWDAKSVEEIKLAATMHDIGKICIPDSVLLKPGPLTVAEFTQVKRHAEAGAEILRGSSVPLLQMAAEIALTHHERWDGTGYPRGLSGKRIPEAGRIVAIVDVYDALVTDRVYRAAYPEDEALEIMRAEKGRHFDPDMFETFLEVLPQMRLLIQRDSRELDSDEELAGAA